MSGVHPIELVLDPAAAAIAALPKREAALALVAALRAARDAFDREARRSRACAEGLLAAVEQWAAGGELPAHFAELAERGGPAELALDIDEPALGLVMEILDGDGDFDADAALCSLRHAVEQSTQASAGAERRVRAAMEAVLRAA